MTTLPADLWPDDEVGQLYRARWQIELLFKRIKQLLHTHRIRCTTAARATATICALLVAWVLLEQLAAGIAARLAQAAPVVAAGQQHAAGTVVVSRWTLQALTLATLRQIVCGQWTLATREACVPRLRRFVVQRSPQRRCQADTIAHWLDGFGAAGA